MYTDDQESFCLVFAFYFTSVVATIRIYYRSLECRNATL